MAFCDAHDGKWILLPDMTDCRELLRVELKGGSFRFPTDLAKKVSHTVQYSANRSRLGCLIPRPGSLWLRVSVDAT